ncbi:MAG: prolyl oligopeptidase family serine peptidase [Pseudomonadota bacterium]
MKKLKKFLIVFFAVLAGAGLFITRDIPAAHPGLKSADLAPLIPTRAFYADPRSAFGYVASSDGRFVAYEQASFTGRRVAVKEVSSDREIGAFPIGLHSKRWHPSKPLLRFIYDGHDWEADPFSPERENWKRISPVRLSGGWQKNQFAMDDEMPILTWGKEHGSGNGHMWLVSQDGLTAEKIAEGNAKTQYWVFDENTQPTLRLDSLDPATTRLFRNTETGWRKLIDIDVNDAFWPLSDVQGDGTLLARSTRGRDKAAIVKFDVNDGTEEVLIANETADVGWATALTMSREPDFVRLGTDSFERIALTERGQVFLDILAEFPQPVSLGFTSPTASGRYVAQALSPQSQSYVYLLIDLQEKSYVTLGEYQFRRFKDSLVQEKPVHFVARDGLEIPAVLMLPKGVTDPIPFVVHIHGGPAQHIGLGYDHESQFLANRGYGVLSVNFRGSTGFGKAFQAAGFKQFGRAMQDDIADAARWLVDEGLADEEALIAMGTSYGGYAAALAMTRDPGLFDAGVVEFPMLDVGFQSKHHPVFWQDGIAGWWRYFGQIDRPEDLEAMRRYSPINRIDDLHGPLLVLGGMRDQITAVQQVKNFEEAALEKNRDVTVHYFAEAGHGVSHWRDQLRRARLIEDFLAEQIGGRSGGFEFAERAPAFID